MTKIEILWGEVHRLTDRISVYEVEIEQLEEEIDQLKEEIERGSVYE